MSHQITKRFTEQESEIQRCEIFANSDKGKKRAHLLLPSTEFSDPEILPSAGGFNKNN